MSGYVTGLVLKRSTMKGAARMVLVVIAESCGDDGKEAWPSIETIAARAAITRRAAQAGIRACQEAGELIVEEHMGGPLERPSRYRTHRYSIPLGAWRIAEGEEAGEEESRGVPRSPLNGSGVQSDASEGRNLTRSRGVPRSPKPSLEPPIEPKDLRAPSGARLFPEDTSGHADVLRGFDKFWPVYPQRNAKKVGKGVCEKIWARLSLEDRRAAYRGARNYAKAVADGLTLAKDPERWLRGRCWVDWQEPAVRRTPEAQEAWG